MEVRDQGRPTCAHKSADNTNGNVFTEQFAGGSRRHKQIATVQNQIGMFPGKKLANTYAWSSLITRVWMPSYASCVFGWQQMVWQEMSDLFAEQYLTQCLIRIQRRKCSCLCALLLLKRGIFGKNHLP